MTVPTVIVLMGPPGCGKSQIGRALRDAGVARCVELEPTLVNQFGTGDSFGVNKAAALRFIRKRTLELIERADGPVALESTGLSDRSLLREIAERHPTVMVEIATSKETCAERIVSRQRSRNISNDLEEAARFHDFWNREVAPSHEFDLSVDGTDERKAVAAIAEYLAGFSIQH